MTLTAHGRLAAAVRRLRRRSIRVAHMLRTLTVLLVASGSAAGQALGPNVLADAGMESPHTDAWPAMGKSVRCEKSAAYARSGRQSLHVVAAGAGWAGVRKDITGLRPGATYRLAYWARVVRGDARIDAWVGDGKRWIGVFGGHSLAGTGVWWPNEKFIRMRDPSSAGANSANTPAKIDRLRIAFRRAGGGAAEFYLDDVTLQESPDALGDSLVRNGSFEKAAAGWSVSGQASNVAGLASDGRSCLRLEPKSRVEQEVRLDAETWYAVRYEWTTKGKGRIAVGLSCRTAEGLRHVDWRTGRIEDTPRLTAPYKHGGFTKGFAAVGVAFRTPARSGPYVLTFVNRGSGDAFLDGIRLAAHEPASAAWAPFEIPYDGDGSLTGKPLRDMAGYLGDGPCSLSDVRARRTRIDRDGFIHVGQDGHFANGRGERVRFYAVNMPGRFAMPVSMDDARRIANRLAKLGVNLVRIHGADHKVVPWAKDRPALFGPASWKPGTTALYPPALERLDSFIAQCKAHGIYVQLDLMTSRTFTPADGVADVPSLLRATPWHKTRLFVTTYDARMIELQKRFQRQLLTHVNRYTGLRYADDPVVASVELKNEEGVLYSGFSRPMYAGYPAHYQQQLYKRWNAWLAARYRDTAALEAAWRAPHAVGLNPQETLGSVAFAPELRGRGPYSRARYADMVRFVSGLGEEYQRLMAAHLRSLGLRCPIRDTQARTRPCQIRAQSRLDYVDAHSYWTAPFDQAMVHSAGGNIIGPAFTAVAGKPMSVSEYNEFCAHQWRAEMPILFAAYAAFQDWDSITLHSYGGSRGRLDETALQFHYIASYGDSPLISQFPVAARIFREGLVRPARQTVELAYTAAQCDSGAPVVWPIPGEAALLHRVRTTGFDAKRPAPPAAAAPRGPYVCDTGELRWDAQAGLVTVQAPQVEAAVGFVGGREVTLAHMALRASTRFAAVSLVSRDGQPLDRSTSILLTAAAQAENTAMVWGDSRTRVLNYGYAPVRCELVRAQVRLRLGPVEVFALGSDGQRGPRVPVRRDRDAVEIDAGPRWQTLWYEIVRNK